MKKFLLLLLCLCLVHAVLAQKSDRQELTEWQFMYQYQWYNATVPGCIHTDLMTNHLIPDPWLGTNEDSVQWVSNQPWKYKTTVQVSPDLRKKKQVALVFDGLQALAEVRVNGIGKGKTNNMFRRWYYTFTQAEIDAAGGELIIEIEFFPTKPNDEKELAKLGFQVPDTRVFTRTAPYQQGWDWGIVLNSCGIWKPVYLVGWNGKKNPLEEEKVEEAKYAKDFPYKKVRLRQQEDSIGQEFVFTVEGKPLFIKGANWIPVHSYPILDSAQKERYRWLLCSAKESNFNMIRVWGGGIYEPDYFYDLCDSLGLMVWNDFNFSCALYPWDTAFLNNVKMEAEEQVKRLSKHPCIVLWCGNNEVKNGWEDWGWQGVYNWTDAQREALAHGIDTLFGIGGILHQAVLKYMPWVDYHPSSPSYGWGHKECVTHGDSHYWGVWWGELPFEVYQEKTGRFMSEYGFMAYPQLSTIEAWSDGEFTFNSYERNAAELLDEPMMKTHQRHARGVQIIDKALQQYYGVDSRDLSMEDYVYLTQLCQAYGTGMGIEAHRIRESHCMGTLYWQLNDCWPVASWSSIDYFGNWKALQYKAKALYEETTILSERVSDSSFRFFIKNAPRAKQFHATLDYCTFTGEKSSLGTGYASPKNWRHLTSKDTLFWFDQRTTGLPRDYNYRKGFVRMRFYTMNGDNKEFVCEKVHFMTYPKDMQLPKAEVEMKVAKRKGGIYRITLSSAVLAKDVQLSVPSDVQGHFSDNYFDLLPGEKKTVTFTVKGEDPAELNLKIKTLNEVLSR